jgi:Na+-transporting methylmalonyl-CoA/oxaloacetate decarboxylase gamma subunit
LSSIFSTSQHFPFSGDFTSSDRFAQQSNAKPKPGAGMTGAIIGAAVGFVFLVVIVLCVVWFVRRQAGNEEDEEEVIAPPEETNVETTEALSDGKYISQYGISDGHGEQNESSGIGSVDPVNSDGSAGDESHSHDMQSDSDESAVGAHPEP